MPYILKLVYCFSNPAFFPTIYTADICLMLGFYNNFLQNINVLKLHILITAWKKNPSNKMMIQGCTSNNYFHRKGWILSCDTMSNVIFRAPARRNLTRFEVFVIRIHEKWDILVTHINQEKLNILQDEVIL